MRNVCVFCGSRTGNDDRFAQDAQTVGRELVARGYGIVFGGGRVGLMGIVADAALAQGGSVIGVIPRALQEREVAHQSLTQLHVVETMHERKALMARLSDAFIALPGGYGTLDELCEIVTWSQLGIHGKPIGLLNTGGYYDPLVAMIDRAVTEGFISITNRGLISEGSHISGLLATMHI